MDRRIIFEISLFFFNTENRKRNFLFYFLKFLSYLIFSSFWNNVSGVESFVSKVMLWGGER